MEIRLTNDEIIYDLEGQIDAAERTQREHNNKMNDIITNLKALRYNLKYATLTQNKG